MTAPVRLQLSRRKGFNLQALSLATNGLEAIIVARPRMDGNPFVVPFVVGVDGTQAECVAKHREAIERDCAADPQAAELMFRRLRGKNLACWCKPGEPCHADVLLELANGAPA